MFLISQPERRPIGTRPARTARQTDVGIAHRCVRALTSERTRQRLTTRRRRDDNAMRRTDKTTQRTLAANKRRVGQQHDALARVAVERKVVLNIARERQRVCEGNTTEALVRERFFEGGERRADNERMHTATNAQRQNGARAAVVTQTGSTQMSTLAFSVGYRKMTKTSAKARKRNSLTRRVALERALDSEIDMQNGATMRGYR